MSKMTMKQRRHKMQLGRKFTAGISSVAGAISFLGQLTSKDRGSYIGTHMQKGQTLANNLLGRLFDWNPFPSVAQFHPLPNGVNTANLWNNNPYVQTGASLIGVNIAVGVVNSLLSRLPYGSKFRIKIPMGRKLATIGSAMLGGGILGALFDGPTNPTNQYVPQTSYNLGTAKPMLQN